MKLIKIDLDGTLLSDDGTISEVNINAIHEAQNQGHMIAISSGRSIQDTTKILSQAGIKCPITTGNGGKSYHNGVELQTWILSDDAVLDLIEILESSNVYYEIYTKNGIMLNENKKSILTDEVKILEQQTSDSLQWTKQIIDLQMKQHGLIFVDDYHTANLNKMGIYKLFILSFNQSKLQRLRTLLENKQVALTSSGDQKLEIGHTKASKGNALLFMANHFNIPLEDTVAIGDNLNDLSMFEVAGQSVAMGNAEEKVKAISTHVTLPYNEDGVAYALKNYIL